MTEAVEETIEEMNDDKLERRNDTYIRLSGWSLRCALCVIHCR